MFTGIVEAMCEVKEANHTSDKSIITLTIKKNWNDICIGDSIAINGVCLTVIKYEQENFTFEIMPETLRLTNLAQLKAHDYVNVERSIMAQARMGGHLVQGHIDGTSRIELIELDGCALKIWFTKPLFYKDCFIPKGFIGIDGMSLTLVDVTQDLFSVSFIPHTQEVTIVQYYQIGTLVNIEIDYFVKTISLILEQKKEAYHGKHC